VTKGFREFEFDLPDALLTAMITAFDQMESASLTDAHLSDIPEKQGVYQLLLDDEIVYIGKTDAEAGLRHRLDRHVWSIQHRCNLEASQVSFKALRVFVFTAMDLENQLIGHYRKSSSISWNDSGFGSNDPGRNRDKTRAKPGGFDVLFPIDLDREIELKETGTMKALHALMLLRKELPYTIRVEGASSGSRKGHPDLLSADVEISEQQTTARTVFTAIVNVLPPGWQATRLAGRVILYKENEEYPAGAVIARSNQQ
jgi:hypothetical protein